MEVNKGLKSLLYLIRKSKFDKKNNQVLNHLINFSFYL